MIVIFQWCSSRIGFPKWTDINWRCAAPKWINVKMRYIVTRYFTGPSNMNRWSFESDVATQWRISHQNSVNNHLSTKEFNPTESAERERETSNTQNVHFEYIINAIILWKEEGKKVSRFFSCERLGFLAHNIKKGQPTTSLYFDKQQTLLLMWASFSHLSTHRDYLCRN